MYGAPVIACIDGSELSELDSFALLAGLLALAGGATAVWALQVRARFSLGAVGACVALFATFVASVLYVG